MESQYIPVKDLEIYKLSRELSKLAWEFYNSLDWQTKKVIGDQFIESSDSVGANIAEGFGKYKGKEYARFIQMALGSARETEYWLELIKEIYPKYSKEVDVIINLNSQTISMLIATLNSLRRQK